MRRLLIVAALLQPLAAAAQQRPRPAPPPVQQPADPPPELPLVYEPQLLRLSEILGAIAYLSQLCGDGSEAQWRQRAEQLIDAEAVTQARRERLAGAYNRGFVGHQAMHRACTDRSRLLMERKIAQARDAARDIANRFGG